MNRPHKKMIHRRRRSLIQDTNRHDDSKNNEHALSAQPFANKQRSQGTSKTSQIVDTRHKTRK